MSPKAHITTCIDVVLVPHILSISISRSLYLDNFLVTYLVSVIVITIILIIIINIIIITSETGKNNI